MVSNSTSFTSIIHISSKISSLSKRSTTTNDMTGKNRFRRRLWGECAHCDSTSPLHTSIDDKVISIAESRDCSKETRDDSVPTDFVESSKLEPVIVSVVENAIAAAEEEEDDEVNLPIFESRASVTKAIVSRKLSQTEDVSTNTSCCADSFLQRSFIKHVFCGHDKVQIYNSLEKPLQSAIPVESIEAEISRLPRSFGDDPKVQEAIECMFASQLENGKPLLLNDSETNKIQSRNYSIVAPSGLHQTVISNRTFSTIQNPLIQQNGTLANSNSNKIVLNAKMIHKGSFYPQKDCEEAPALASVSDSSGTSLSCMGDDSFTSNHEASHANRCCRCERWFSPALDPEMWPQRPLLLRPTPNGGTRVKGVRYAGSNDYLWQENRSNTGWHDALRQKWDRQKSDTSFHLMCSHCVALPINNGNEEDGEILVTDFESDLFDGSLLVRIRGAEGTSREAYDDTKGYFSDVNRKYQVVVQGRFKKPMLWTECFSGIRLARPCGKLPSKWIIKSAINVVKFFAPQLDAKVDGPNPHTFSPLGSTPQTIIVDKFDAPNIVSIAGPLKEPIDAEHTLMQSNSSSASTIQRARQRKKTFDKIFTENDKTFFTDPNKVYTFEFLQHLINFQDFSVTLGSVFGSISLNDILDGQPIQILARHQEENLWSFDVWHELLYADSLRYDQQNSTQ